MEDVPKGVLILALNLDLEKEMALVGGLGGIKDSLTIPLRHGYLHHIGFILKGLLLGLGLFYSD